MTAPRALARQPVWDAASARLVCTAVRDEAAGVKTFRWTPEDGSRVRFRAGQALTLAWRDAAGALAPRTFTIASSPDCHAHVETTVKASAAGATADMHRRCVPGTMVRAFGPAGRFGLAFHPARKVLLVGAGSGVTPMMSMLRQVRDRGDGIDVACLVFASTPADVLFADELGAIVAAAPAVRVVPVVSRVPAGERWLGPSGRLSRRLLAALVPDARHRETFLCGPPGFMEAARRALLAEGLDRSRLHTESFGAPAPPPAAAPVAPPAGWTARLARSGRTVPIDAGRTLYEALRAAGVVVPTGCRSGICGTCRTKGEGPMAVRHRGGLSPAEERAGHVLPCCTFPAGDVTLDL